jgi:predicted PurR-regulated permease PerM
VETTLRQSERRVPPYHAGVIAGGIALSDRATLEAASRLDQADEYETESAPPASPAVWVPLLVIAVIMSFAAITWLGPILQPLLIAMFAFFMLRPLTRILTAIGFNDRMAWILVFGVVLLLAALFSRFLLLNATAVRERIPEWRTKLETKLGGISERDSKSLGEVFNYALPTKDLLAYVLKGTLGFAEGMILTFFYLLFLLMSSTKFGGRIRKALPPDQADRMLEIGNKVSEGMEEFLRVKTLVSLGLGATSGVICWAFGLEYGLLWGFVFFALNYITYLGSFVALVPPILQAFIQFENPWAAAALATVITANRFLWIDWIEIRYGSTQLNIDSIILFLWLAYWGWAWGITGLVLAVPMLTALKIILSNLDAGWRFALLMSEE